MNHNKKGFTLIELLAIIIIIAVLLLIAIPLISNIISSVRERTCFLNTKSMEKAALNYVIFEGQRLPESNSVNIPLQKLRNKNYITPVLDPSNLKTECDGYVKITEQNGDYKTEGHLICPTYCNADEFEEEEGTEKNDAYYFDGVNPNNWVLFGRYDQSSVYGLLWRIVKTDDGGRKLIFEGLENYGNKPLEDGRVSINGTTGVPYDSKGNNKYKPSSLKQNLATWLNNIYVIEKNNYIKETNWKIGGVPFYNPTSLDSFIELESIDTETEFGNFSGVSDLSGVGLLNPSDYMLTSSNPGCVSSYELGGSFNPCIYTETDLNNFLYKNKYHYWTMNPSSNSDDKAWYINNIGHIATTLTDSSVISARPVINIDNTLPFLSGNGTIEDPYILEDYMINIKNAPVINLIGNDTIIVRENDYYLDQGATAYDSEDGDITDKIKIKSNVNTSIPGEYKVEYNVVDSDGNEAPTVTRQVIVSELNRPVINLNGDNPLILTLNHAYTELGATAIDLHYGDISNDIIITGDINNSELGVYEIKYNVTNIDGVEAITVIRRVIVEPPRPVITLNGDNPTNLYVGEVYEELGATAVDEVDGDLTDLITKKITRYETIRRSNENEIIEQDVNEVILNKNYRYEITYSVTNSYGVTTDEIRKVLILPDNGPKIEFIPNGSTTAMQSHGVQIKVTKTQHDIDNSSLKYMWVSENWRMPSNSDLESLIRTNFSNNNTINRSNTTGLYKLYAIAKDIYGNTTIKATDYFKIDNSRPQMWLVGPNPQRVLIESPYVERGATAYDKYYSGDLTERIEITSNVKVNQQGTYTTVYSVVDDAGNATSRSRTIIVYLSKPIIALKGSKTEKVILGQNYVEPGYSATDERDGNITNQVIVTGTVNENKVGIYPVTYTVTNSYDISTTITRDVEVYIPEPEITIIGDNPLSHMVLEPYTDLGATAFDLIDGDITSKIQVSSNINVGIKGKYEVVYTVKNNNGKTTTKKRIVDVFAPKPVVTLNGNSFVKMFANELYEELGATATDEIDGDVTNDIKIIGSVNPSKLGTYQLKYQVTNSFDEVGYKIRTVQVTEPAISITLFGKSPDEAKVTRPYFEPGYVATHELLGDITNKIEVSGNVNTNKLGTYKINYKYTDNNFLIPFGVTREVQVIPPEVTLKLNGGDVVDLLVTDVYRELGATATDEIDGDISHLINIKGAVNTNVEGEYTIDYEVTSNYGVKQIVTRIVNINPNEGPLVTFTPDGSFKYERTYSVKINVNVNANKGQIDEVSFKYLWSTDQSKPHESSFNKKFINGEIISSPSGASGNYYLWVIAKDIYNNTTIKSSTRYLLDNTEPLIKLNGASVLEIPVDSVYEELGATVIEEHSGLNDDGLIITSNITPGVLGTYTVNYNATDNVGLNSITVTRTVNVIEASLKDALGEGFVPKYRAEYFVGPDPRNWVEFGNASDNIYDYIPILWRIIKSDNEGIKLIYEGPYNEGKKPLVDGKITDISFDEVVSNYNDASVRSYLEQWYSDLNEPNKATLTSPIKWCVGGINEPYDIDTFKDEECLIKTSVESSIGLLNSVDYLLTSTDPCDSYNQIGCGTTNFLNKSYDYMTINGVADHPGYIFGVESNGALRRSPITKLNGVRPVINLRSDILILGGEGSLEKPYKLNTRVPVLDDNPPTVLFEYNEPNNYKKTHEIKAIVTDDISGVDPSSLKYFWSPSKTEPTLDKFEKAFLNGESIKTPDGVTSSYYLWVVAKDRKGNQAIVMSDAVRLDNQPPVITLKGKNIQVVNLGEIYKEEGATATDNISGNLSSKIIITGTVNPNIEGDYQITYTVEDSAGNVAVAKRKVTVRYTPLPNKPILSDGMTPIKWNGMTEVETIEEDPEWYDYSAKKWANAKTADGSYWVWIPRYAYKITKGYHTRTAGDIDILFLENQDTIEGTPTYDANGIQVNYVTHPAFTFGNDELFGYWAAKFEASTTGYVTGSGYCSNSPSDDNPNRPVKILPDVDSWRCISISNAFIASRNMEKNSIYGWVNSGVDTHMLKNTEWGAIAYLSKSDYGKVDEIWTNPNYYKNGCAGSHVNSTGTSACIKYNTWNGQFASTTGNIYGIYDMNGGSNEFVPAYIENDNASLFYGESVIEAENKYKNIYNIGSKDNAYDNYNANANSFGHALYETSSTGTGNNGWYSDASTMINGLVPWLQRGNYHVGSAAGIFAFTAGNGSPNNKTTFRPAVITQDLSPTITLNGNETVYHIVGTPYNDLGATAIDQRDGDITDMIVVSGNLNINTPGDYEVIYTVEDSGGNKTSKVRIIIIKSMNENDFNNHPVLSEGMTPIKWNGFTEIETTTDDSEWYDYSEKKWANAKTADGSYWVWVPRFSYKILSNYHKTLEGEIDVKFLQGKSNVTFEGNMVFATPAYEDDTQTNYIVHPAFTFGNDSLDGFWVGKFQASGNRGSINILPSASILARLKIDDIFNSVINMKNLTKYGWSNDNIDTHLMKNTEWGAIAYLSASSYGHPGRIWMNSNRSGTTGYAGNSENDVNGYYTYAYNTWNGQRSSTTGNITGIYDMRGAGKEIVASYIDNSNSYFERYAQSVLAAPSKYKTKYEPGQVDNSTANYNNAQNVFGDAIYETSSRGTSNYAWGYSDSNMPYSHVAWFHRGGSYSNSKSSIFSYYPCNGSDSSSGIDNAFRPIVVVFDE